MQLKCKYNYMLTFYSMKMHNYIMSYLYIYNKYDGVAS